MPISYRQLLQIAEAVKAGRMGPRTAQRAIGPSVDLSAVSALDFPGRTMFRSSAADVAAGRGPLPRDIEFVTSRGVGEDMPGMGFPTRPNVSRAIPVGSAAAPGRTASPYRFPGGPTQPPIDVEVLPPRSPLTVFDPRNVGSMRPTGVVVEDLTQYPQSSLPGGFRTPYPDVMAPGAGREPGIIPFSEEVIRNALTNGVRTGNLNEILGLTAVGAGTALATGLLGAMMRRERKEPQAQIPIPGTVPQINPPGVVPQPGQETGGVEQAPSSPVPQSPAGQVVLTTPGDSDERLRELVQQYTGKKAAGARPGGKEVKNELAEAYAAQADFGRQNIDKIVNELGLTGNMEIWARSNPLPAARLYLQMEAEKQQKTNLNQRTEFPSAAETQPRGISQQTPSAVQGKMINTTLGADFERNRQGSIQASTNSQVMPTQGSFDLAQALTPLAQPTLINRENYQIQSAAQQAQLRDLIFQQFGAR